jgi:hypothetical protein
VRELRQKSQGSPSSSSRTLSQAFAAQSSSFVRAGKTTWNKPVSAAPFQGVNCPSIEGVYLPPQTMSLSSFQRVSEGLLERGCNHKQLGMRRYRQHPRLLNSGRLVCDSCSQVQCTHTQDTLLQRCSNDYNFHTQVLSMFESAEGPLHTSVPPGPTRPASVVGPTSRSLCSATHPSSAFPNMCLI